MLLDDHFWPEFEVATGFIELETANGPTMLVLPDDPLANEENVHVLEPDCWLLVEDRDGFYSLIDTAKSVNQFGRVKLPLRALPGWTRRHVTERLETLGLATALEEC